MKSIVQKEAEILREMSTEVDITELNSPRMLRVLSEMKYALASQEDGVAIAAPQIGYSLRVFIVSHKVPHIIQKGKRKNTKEKAEKNAEAEEETSGEEQDMIFINPVIKKLSKEKSMMEEGCLSVRYLYGKVSRSKKATIEYFDETGKKFTAGASGLLAQIFQHEIDHLNGILFIDKAKYLEEVIPDHIQRNTKEKYTNAER